MNPGNTNQMLGTVGDFKFELVVELGAEYASTISLDAVFLSFTMNGEE